MTEQAPSFVFRWFREGESIPGDAIFVKSEKRKVGSRNVRNGWSIDAEDILEEHYLCKVPVEIEREKEKPKCEHQWVKSNVWKNGECVHCGTPNVTPATMSPEPVKKQAECEHVWINPLGYGYHCGECGAPKVTEQGRKPREFSLYKFADGELRAFPSDQATVAYAGFTAPIFICATREILPGEKE